LAVRHGLACGFVGGDGHEGDRAGRGGGVLRGEERRKALLDDAENSLGLERRAVQPLLDLGGETCIEGLGIQPLDDFADTLSDTHEKSLPDQSGPTVSGRTYVWN